MKLYHFVHTILFIPFCPIPFCPYTILSIPFCPYHFVRYHFVRSPYTYWTPLPSFHHCVRPTIRQTVHLFQLARPLPLHSTPSTSRDGFEEGELMDARPASSIVPIS